jgi:hypothetical protein
VLPGNASIWLARNSIVPAQDLKYSPKWGRRSHARRPQSVDFFFNETDGATREVQTEQFRRLVDDFMKGLRAA